MKGSLARATIPAGPQPLWLRASEARIEGQVIEVTAGMGARVDRVLVGDNQMVERRQHLVTLDSRDLDRQLEKAGANLARTVAATDADQGILSRVEIGPSPAIADARKRYVLARLDRSNAEIRAPASGRVLATAIRPGDLVSAGQPLVSILDSDDLWVMARFAPRDFAGLRLGQRARVMVGLRHLDATVTGFVTAEEPVLLEFDTRPHPGLRPGMHVAATVRADAGDRSLPWRAFVP